MGNFFKGYDTVSFNKFTDLIVIDCGRDVTTIHRIDLNIGQYLVPVKVKGTFDEQVTRVFDIMKSQKPTKIVIDEIGVGKGFADRFKWRALHPDAGFVVDGNGNVRYL